MPGALPHLAALRARPRRGGLLDSSHQWRAVRWPRPGRLAVATPCQSAARACSYRHRLAKH
eukprot:scaffold2261_cov405-Prasinococcus_capsulatus_cf.AAC.31